jgi:hypothetical protein
MQAYIRDVAFDGFASVGFLSTQYTAFNMSEEF